MTLRDAEPEVPRWLAGLIVVGFAASLLYGILVLQNVLAILAVWFGLLGVGVSLFVVYLLYRLVVAVEQIAAER